MAIAVSLEINEGTSVYLSVACTNHAGTSITPTAMVYMIYDLTAGVQVLDWTSATPGDPTEIHILPAQTALLAGQSRAIRAVRVVATYGVNDQSTSEYLLGIRSLSGADPT